MPDYDRRRTEAPAASAAPGLQGAPPGKSNAQVQERLRAGEHVDTEVDPAGEDDLAESLVRDAFMSSRFAEEDYRPSSGLGCFDAAYEPSTGTLDIVLRLAFEFTVPEGASMGERALAAVTGDAGWSDADKEKYVAEYKQVVESTWGGAHALRCVRPGWEHIVAAPRLRLEVVDADAGDPHYVVTVHGRPPALSGSDDQRPVVRNPGVLGGAGTAEMDHDDVKSRPLGDAVVKAEKSRIEALLPQPGIRVDDDGVQARIRAADVERLERLAAGLRLSERYPSGPQFSIQPVGWAQDPSQFEASQRATRATTDAFDRLAPGRASPPMEWGDDAPGLVKLHIDEKQASTARSPDFSYAAHETGHMLGLEDEYEGSPREEAGVASNQDALAVAAGADWTPATGTATSSVMSQGTDVLPAHSATFWEVLTRMTAGYLRPSEWQIGG